MQPKFYSDENIPLAISNALKKRGIDILTVHEAGLLQKEDKRHLSFALSEKRAIITHDSDFLKLIVKEEIKHYGIIYFTRQMKIGQAIEEIEKIYLTYSHEELRGAVLFVPQQKEGDVLVNRILF